MGWIKRKADEHTCSKPNYSDRAGIAEGDIWECDLCKAQWRVKKVNTWYDQRDNSSGGYLDWELHGPARIVLPPQPRGYDPGVTSWRDR